MIKYTKNKSNFNNFQFNEKKKRHVKQFRKQKNSKKYCQKRFLNAKKHINSNQTVS